MTDFYSYELVESIKCTQDLFQETSGSSQAPDREISNDGPFHPFCFSKTKMGSRERKSQSSWFQKFTLSVIVEWKTFDLFFL